MKDHYRILDLPKDATEEQVRAQYKLLVRVYHPDRFSKPEDKIYAEQKIKEINDAYNALIKTNGDASTGANGDQPVPVVIPSYIDFGTLLVGERKTVPLTVSNARGDIEDLQFDFSETNWFTLSENRLLTDNSKSPLQFEVVATTDTMSPGRVYKGWIDVRMKSNVTRVNISMKVVREKTETSRIGSIVRNVGFGAALLAVAAGAAYLGPRYLPSASTQPNPADKPTPSNSLDQRVVIAPPTSSIQQAGSAVRGHSQLLPELIASDGKSPTGEAALGQGGDNLVYPIVDNNDLVLYTSRFDGTGQQRFKFAGQNIAWSNDGTRVAYLLRKDGAQQILVAQSADRIGDQLTNTPNPKSDLVWAPDDSQLAYVQIEDGQRILYLTAPGGRSPRALSNPRLGSVGSFSWSPDSRSLLFDVEVDGKHRVYQVNADGSGLKQFTSLDAYDPAWSPDETVILVASTKGLLALDKDGKQLRQITKTPTRLPRWSPDGTQFAYLELTAANSSNANLVVSDSTGRKTEKWSSGAIINFAWSPNSNRLAFVSGQLSKTGLSTLYLWTVASGEDKQLVAETNDPFVTWIP